MDIPCALCQEPWDAQEMRESEPAEYRKFIRGQGCPSCDFGTTCPDCDGSGVERRDLRFGPPACPICLDRNVTFVRHRIVKGTGETEPESGWYHGYQPKLTILSTAAVNAAGRITTRTDNLGTFDEVTAKIKCPNLGGAGHAFDEPCHRCHGDGRFHAEGDHTHAFLDAAVDSTDEDPIGILAAFAASQRRREEGR